MWGSNLVPKDNEGEKKTKDSIPLANLSTLEKNLFTTHKNVFGEKGSNSPIGVAV